MQELQTNTTLQSGKYRIERVLGQGGFGITYLATDIALDRKVAVKEFFPKDYCGRNGTTSHVTLGTESAADFVQRLKAKFLKEVRNIAKLDHPGIIRIHAAFEENNTAYYVMEYIEGENLAEMVNRNGRLPDAKAIHYIEKVGEALKYIHDRKINHLDIKPANIMVRREDDRPILIDFGLSKQYDSRGDATSTMMQAVSHGYSPIELYNVGSVSEFSPQTDVYSLAATLYFLFVGKVPPSPSEILDNGLSFPPTINVPLKVAIEEGMRSRRSKRPQSINTFIGLIRNIEEDKSEDSNHYSSSTTSSGQNSDKYSDETQVIDSEDYNISGSFFPNQSKGEVKPNTNFKQIGNLGIVLGLCLVGLFIFVLNKNSMNNDPDVIFSNGYLLKNGLKYKIIDPNKFKLEIINGDGVSGKVIIPSSLVYENRSYQVISIGEHAFRDNQKLDTVIIPNSVIKIKNEAFICCRNLSFCDLPPSLESIGERAFSACNKLESIKIPDKVKRIRPHTFDDCFSLVSIILSNSLISIEKYAFYQCYKIKTIDLPNSLSRIESGAFNDCKNLSRIIIPESVNSIKEVFGGCENLTSVILPNTILSVERAFIGCSNLTNIHLPESVNNIDGAFSHCINLKDVNIPSSISSIGEYTFASCSNLNSITLPNTIIAIGNEAFSHCSKLKSINIPNSVKSIGGLAFSECNGLSSITIPNSVTEIGKYAFWECKNLTEAIVPSYVYKHKNIIFYGCNKLYNIKVYN